MKRFQLVGFLLSILVLSVWLISCEKMNYIEGNTFSFPRKLSVFNIYKGVTGSLIFNEPYDIYTISTPLFSDYSEKQRLIKLPNGKKLSVLNDGLPEFPDSSILVKTFFYYKDKRDTAAGKILVETRILILVNGEWNASTYKWRADQADADLIESGFDLPVNWINEEGIGRVLSYRIPSKVECGHCHKSNDKLIPIGVKIRNLNFTVSINGQDINQLNWFSERGLLEKINPGDYAGLPAWNNVSMPLDQRARAYLDVNCAHCHYNKGLAPKSSLKLSYDIPFAESGIKRQKDAIEVLMKRGSMPLIGTTIIDKEGFKLISDYLKSIQ